MRPTFRPNVSKRKKSAWLPQADEHKERTQSVECTPPEGQKSIKCIIG